MRETYTGEQRSEYSSRLALWLRGPDSGAKVPGVRGMALWAAL